MKKIDFTKEPQCNWSREDQLSFLQRRIIVYSLMYYELNESCVSDKYYDEASRQYVQMAKQVDDETLQKTDYYYCMYDFDGTTGFDINGRLTEDDKEYILKIIYTITKR